MKTTWIVGGLLLVVLLLLTLRERFETYEQALQSVGQTSGQIPPTCPSGMTLKSGGKTCEKTTSTGSVETATPQCATGYNLTQRGTNWSCVSQTPTTPSPPASGTTSSTSGSTTSSSSSSTSESTPPADGMASESSSVPGSTGVGATSGTDTGGTSGMSFGPNSQSKMLGQKVWGPASKGLGEDGQGPKAGDTTKSTPYPVLLGGETGKSSTRIEGVGIVPPSFSGLSSTLPSSKVLGAEDSARFLPFSREPGDQDLIPDPYRLAKNFSTSSYTASKTDPVPFLTDFSAFYK